MDRLGRDRLVGWLKEAGLDVAVDRIGNIFGIWQNDANAAEAPVMLGSHIDTVIDAGIYDGCYGVLAGLEAIESLNRSSPIGAICDSPTAEIRGFDGKGRHYTVLAAAACASVIFGGGCWGNSSLSRSRRRVSSGSGWV